MAAAAEVRQGEVEEKLCPVCKDPSARDPRVLDCGHHFCKSCLERLVVDKTITCPTCRYVTQVNAGVSRLAMHRTTNLFSRNVEQLIQRKTHDMDKLCVKCEREAKKATKTCMECWVELCDDCAPIHSKAEDIFSHTVYPICNHMYCDGHGDKGILFHCTTCSSICCPMCILGEHREHNLEKVRVARDNVKKRLLKIREDMDAAQGEEILTKTLKRLLVKAKGTRDTFKTTMKSIQTALNDLSTKLNQVNEEVSSKMAATIKTLEMMSSDIGDYMTSKVSLRKLLTYLIEDASSPEMVAREKELPKYDMTTYKQVIREKEVEIPELGDTFSEITDKLERCQQQLDIAFTKHSVCGPYDTKPLSNLQKVTTIQAGNNTWGLAVDSGRQRLVVRRMDATAPISVYDFQGKQLHVLGQGADGINTADHQGIAIDTKRDLYVLPVNNGSLVTMDMNGNVKDKIKVTDQNYLNGVAYSDDFYITGNAYNEVYVTDAQTKQKVAAFSPSTTFSNPYNVGVGPCLDTGEQVFIVSSFSSHCIKVLGSSGRLLHTYGKEGKYGQGEGELYHPWGVCTDPGGRIIVCDEYNHRVVAFWREDGKDKWETLLGKDKLGGKDYPLHVTCDPVSRKLFVGYNDGTVHVYQ